MHDKGFEGSHKTPAKEIWTVDLASKKRVARTPGNNAIALAVSQGDGAACLPTTA
jgi:methylamine dehydrogenase heavy chain